MASSSKASDVKAGVKTTNMFSGWRTVKKKKRTVLSFDEGRSHHSSAEVHRRGSDDGLSSPPTSHSEHTANPPAAAAAAAANGSQSDAKTSGGGASPLAGKQPREVYSSPFPSVHDGPTPASISDVYSRWGHFSTLCRTLMCPPPSRNGQPIGLLELDIFEGFRLPASDLGISSDPYLVATLTGYACPSCGCCLLVLSIGEKEVARETFEAKEE